LLVETNDRVPKTKIRIVLADDHQALLARVRRVLAEDYEVIGTVENGSQAVDAVLTLNPDVLVIDISMPVVDGLQAARQLQKANCRTKIIFLTIHEDHDFVAAAFTAGALGYVTKARLSTDLGPAILEVMQGRAFISKFGPSNVTSPFLSRSYGR
jgi:DNA-binding NarL/FixJ family response regulator